MKELRNRCWINVDGEKYFGPGPLRLLQFIEQEGSLAKAAKAMGMSYKKAWDMVDQLNKKASSPVVVSKKGGSKGGGTEITERGKQLMDGYTALERKLDSVLADNIHLLDII